MEVATVKVKGCFVEITASNEETVKKILQALRKAGVEIEVVVHSRYCG